MEIQERALVMIASKLLVYPDDLFFNDWEAIKGCLEEQEHATAVFKGLETAMATLGSLPLTELRKLYVATFDLREKCGLYLTAHELGDSPKRGAALIKLQKQINLAGYERVDDELADFIPMLLEFLAVAPVDEANSRLIKRLAVAIHRIKQSLSKENPYLLILSTLTLIFPEPTREDIKKLEFNREEADLEELPFPLMYQ